MRYPDGMVVTILGCGTSTGVPVIGCDCAVCRSKNPRNHRLRASIWIRARGRSLLVDTSTDLRQQALVHRIPRVDAVLYTHPHADHISGIDELRAYNFKQEGTIPVYGNAWTARELRQKFEYIFKPGPVEGGGIPKLTLHEIDPAVEQLDVAGVPVVPIPVKHGSQDCLGYRIDSIAYVTDCSYIPPASLERMSGLSVLILDCLRIKAHGTHLNLEQALGIIAKVKPRRAVLTHMGHDLDYGAWHGVKAKKLPKGVAFAYDGLTLKCEGASRPANRRKVG